MAIEAIGGLEGAELGPCQHTLSENPDLQVVEGNPDRNRRPGEQDWRRPDSKDQRQMNPEHDGKVAFGNATNVRHVRTSPVCEVPGKTVPRVLKSVSVENGRLLHPPDSPKNRPVFPDYASG